MLEKMSRIGLKKEKYDTDNEHPRENCNEGTAARTRPLSFNEVMLRRKNKKLFADDKEGDGRPEKLSEKSNVENVSEHSEPGGGDKRSKDPVFSVTKQGLEDIEKGSARKKEEKTSMKKDDIFEGKDKESLDFDTKMKPKSSKDLRSRTRGEKNEKRKHHRSRNDEGLKDDTDNEYRKHSRDTAGKDRFVDRKREKSEKESKRRHRNEDGEKHRSEIDGGSVKKQDPGKFHVSEPSERKGRKKESSRSHYEEVRPKRKRSRSREHDRDRDKSSFSPSPRAHKHTTHGREYGLSSFHSSSDRSARQHTDIERMLSNGGFAGSQYRRHAGYSSGIGGYSPRKRKSEAAVKTPSPTNRSPERRSAGWDLPPAGKDGVAAGSTLNMFPSSQQDASSTAHEMPSAFPVTSTAARSVPVTSNIILPPRNDAIDSIQLTQATRPMRRLYVENIPASASEKAVMECFNNFLLSSGVNRMKGIEPCISCIINKEKSQGLVEFLTAEDASTAMSFEGRFFSGSILKIRRPKDFVEAATGVSEKSVAAVNAISDIVEDSPHKIFIGGIPKALSSKMLMEITSAFGLLKAYHFQIDEDLNESCAFLEYVDQSITLKACAGLSGMKLGGQVLTAVRATPDASIEENMEKPPFYGVPEHAKPLLERPTQVIKLRNMFNQEDLQSLSLAELDEVLEDIRLECARFGAIKSVNFVKYNTSSALECEAFDGINDTNMRITSEESQDDDDAKKTETSGEDPDHDVVKNSVSSSPGNVRECPEDGVADGNGINKETPIHDCTRDVLLSEKSEIGVGMSSEEPTCQMNTDGTQEFPNQLDSLKDQLTCHDDDGSDITRAKDSSVANTIEVAKELRLEEATDTKLPETSTELLIGVAEEPGDSDLGDVFEPGCVLVEYVRTEASCMAAHCLHGRLFGEQVVAVSYVARDPYLARFPK